MGGGLFGGGPPRAGRLQVEHPGGVAAQDAALLAFVQERQVVDGGRRVEIPMRPVRRVEKLRLGLDRLERRLDQLHVVKLDRLGRVVHVGDVLAGLALEERRLRGAHHVLGIEPLHQVGQPGEPAFDPNHLQLGEAFGQAVDYPVRHVHQVAVHERQGVHRQEPVELGHRAVLPVEPGMEGERQAALLEHRIEAHVAIVVHRPVARRGHGEADDAGLVGELLDEGGARLGRVERQVQKPAQASILRQHLLGQPAIVGAAQLDLDLGLRMYPQHQHGRREHRHDVDAHRIHRAARQHRLAVPARLEHRLAQLLVVRDAAHHALIGEARLQIHQTGDARPALLERFRVVFPHVGLDPVGDLVPERELGDVRIDIDDHELVELLAVAVARRVGQRIARVGLDRELGKLARLSMRIGHASLSGVGMGRSIGQGSGGMPTEHDRQTGRAGTARLGRRPRSW
jgi:hypothetical protein